MAAAARNKPSLACAPPDRGSDDAEAARPAEGAAAFLEDGFAATSFLLRVAWGAASLPLPCLGLVVLLSFATPSDACLPVFQLGILGAAVGVPLGLLAWSAATILQAMLVAWGAVRSPWTLLQQLLTPRSTAQTSALATLAFVACLVPYASGILFAAANLNCGYGYAGCRPHGRPASTCPRHSSFVTWCRGELRDELGNLLSLASEPL